MCHILPLGIYGTFGFLKWRSIVWIFPSPFLSSQPFLGFTQCTKPHFCCRVWDQWLVDSHNPPPLFFFLERSILRLESATCCFLGGGDPTQINYAFDFFLVVLLGRGIWWRILIGFVLEYCDNNWVALFHSLLIKIWMVLLIFSSLILSRAWGLFFSLFPNIFSAT